MTSLLIIILYGLICAAIGAYVGYDLRHTETDDWDG